MAFVVYEMEAIGVGGALEAVAVHPFCSEACQSKHTIEGPVQLGENSSSFESLVCETCGKPMPCALTTAAELIDITPVGLKTLEGAEKATVALKEWDQSTVSVAEAADEFLAAYDEDEDVPQSAQRLREALRVRRVKQECFLHAVAGQS